MVSDTIPVANPTPGIGFGGNGGSAVQVPGILDSILKLDWDMALAGRRAPMTRAEVQAYKGKWNTFMARVKEAISQRRDQGDACDTGQTGRPGLDLQRRLFRASVRRAPGEPEGRAEAVMIRLTLAFITGLTLFAVAGLQQPAGTLHTGKAFRFNQVKTGSTTPSAPARSSVVGTPRSSSTTTTSSSSTITYRPPQPGALDEIKSITDKPVRTVINTHFHFDHAHGNQVFGNEVESSATSSRATCCWGQPAWDAALQATLRAAHARLRI